MDSSAFARTNGKKRVSSKIEIVILEDQGNDTKSYRSKDEMALGS